MPMLKRFSRTDIEAIKWMAARGFGGTEIARRLNRAPQAIRVKAVELGIRLRPMPGTVTHPVRGAALRRADRAGQGRNTTPAKLARLILITVLSDNMVNAILDVPVGEAKPLPTRAARAKPAPLPAPPPHAPAMASVFSPMLLGRL